MVIAVADVERWVQPELISGSTTADAVARIFAPSDVEPLAVAGAEPAFTGAGSTQVAVGADAPIFLIVENYPLPLAVADAAVEITTDFTTDDFVASTLLARLDITAPAVSVVAGYADAVFGVIPRPTGVSVAVEGDAEIAFGDFGMDTPVFPFTLPFQFTDLSVQPVGDAAIRLDNTGSLDAVGGIAEAEVRLDNSTPLTLKGTVTMFPFRLPGVFDSEANVRLGTALVELDRPVFPTSVAVDAVAEVPIYGASDALRQTIFAFTFPAIFDSSGYATADAFVSMVGECSAVVVQDANAVVDISTFMSVDSSAVFPWTFGVIFT